MFGVIYFTSIAVYLGCLFIIELITSLAFILYFYQFAEKALSSPLISSTKYFNYLSTSVYRVPSQNNINHV